MAPSPRSAVIERLGTAINRAVVLCGHSHRQSLTQIPSGPLILNPGTVGCPVSPDHRLALSLEFRSPNAPLFLSRTTPSLRKIRTALCESPGKAGV